MTQADEYAEVVITCPSCSGQMSRREVVEQKGGTPGPRIELYQCVDVECARKAALMYEPGGGLTDDQQTFIEREVARLGAFFPSDYTGSNRR